MKAAVLTNLAKPLEIRQLTIPDLQMGQVLVQIAYSGVCHSQLMEARGHRGVDAYLPHLLGHEGTGIVRKVGAGVTKVKPGDKVVLGWIKASGLDAKGIHYQCDGEKINAGGVTTFNEQAIVAENRLVLLPDGVPMDLGVLFGCAIPTGAGIITNTIQPKPGSSIAIFGLGGIGLSALMALKLFECAKIIAIDVSSDKLELAKELGATDVIDARTQDAVQEIRKLTGGLGADYSVEASGLAKTIEQAFESIRRGGGLCIFASHPAHGEKIAIDPYELICGKEIRGTWGGQSNPDRDVPLFAKAYRDGKLPLEKLISKRYSLGQINEALDDLESKTVARPLIEINPALC